MSRNASIVLNGKVARPEAPVVAVRALRVGTSCAAVFQRPPLQLIVDALRSQRVWLLVSPWLYLTVVMWGGRAWLGPGLPEGDLAGAAADLARWQGFLAEGQLTANWDSTSFLGHPRSLVNLYSGMAAAYLPFLLFFEPLMAVKLGCLVYLALGGIAAMALIRAVTGNTAAAIILGLAYALHPIHLSLTAASSHANFPPFYALQPLILWALLALLDRPTQARAALLALAAALAGWMDLERLAVLAPGLAVLAGAIVVTKMARSAKAGMPSRDAWLHSSAGVLGAALLCAGLLAVLWLPAVIDKPLHALFSEETRASSVEFFSVRNPLYYVDPSGVIFGSVYRNLPPELAHDAGTFYLGLTLLGLIGLGLLVRRDRIQRPEALIGLVLATAVTLAAAHGPFSGYRSLGDVLDEVFLHAASRAEGGTRLLVALIGALVGVTAALTAAALLLRQGRGRWGWWVIAASVAIVLFTTPYTWLAKAPPFADMRNPGWFLTALPPLALVTAAGIGLAAALAQIERPIVRGLLIGVVILSLAWEAGSYRDAFDRQLHGQAVEELAFIGDLLRRDERSGRVLTRESYNPHTDLVFAYSGRPTAWYWLNWMAPVDTSRLFLDSIYRDLHHPDTIEQALEQAGQAHVRFVLYDLMQGPPPPPTDALRPIWSGRSFALYENTRCRPFAYIEGENLVDAPPVRWTRDLSEPGVLRVDVKADQPVRVVMAESWTPRWRATVDGEAVAVERVHEALIGVPVPAGQPHVVLRHESGWTSTAGAGVSLLSGFLFLGLVSRPMTRRVTSRIRRQSRDMRAGADALGTPGVAKGHCA